MNDYMRSPTLVTCSLLLALLGACGGGGGGGGGGDIVAPPPATTIRDVTADLLPYVETTLPYVQGFSEGYVVPDSMQLARFDVLLGDLLAHDVECGAGLEPLDLLGAEGVDRLEVDNTFHRVAQRVQFQGIEIIRAGPALQC